MKFFILAAFVVVAAANSVYLAPSNSAAAYSVKANSRSANSGSVNSVLAYSTPAVSRLTNSGTAYSSLANRDEATSPSVVEIIEYPPQPYSFSWAVKDDYSNDYSHSESSDGEVTTGNYHVHLPDGRIQRVTYRADSNGYVADVKYEGEAVYPEFKPVSAASTVSAQTYFATAPVPTANPFITSPALSTIVSRPRTTVSQSSEAIAYSDAARTATPVFTAPAYSTIGNGQRTTGSSSSTGPAYTATAGPATASVRTPNPVFTAFNNQRTTVSSSSAGPAYSASDRTSTPAFTAYSNSNRISTPVFTAPFYATILNSPRTTVSSSAATIAAPAYQTLTTAAQSEQDRSNVAIEY